MSLDCEFIIVLNQKSTHMQLYGCANNHFSSCLHVCKFNHLGVYNWFV
uniref:Uncharacterized protein n=1 Tax=Rhizophora mucronata TaxID=61149 RepID=A0A2P2PSK9_RHIMU